MILINRIPRFSLGVSLGLALALGACSGDDSGTASAGETSTGSTATTGDTATSTTSGSASATTSASGSESATGDSSTTSTSSPTTGETSGTSASTGVDTTGDPTTGTTGDPTTGTTGDVGDGCMIACGTLVECNPDWTLQDCLDACHADFADNPEAACQAAKSDANACIGTLTCDEILNDDLGECVPLVELVDQACMPGMQECVPSQMAMGKGCSVDFDCGDAVFRMQCNQNNCACLEDGQQVGGCANADFCALDLDAAVAAANECCGWTF